MNNCEHTPRKLDDSYNRMIEFAKNHRQHGGFSNLYLIKRIDPEGNVTGEFYGMNMMTDYGMDQYFIKNGSFPTKLYVGQGSNEFNYVTQTLSEKIPDVTMAATVSDTSKYYNFPMYYDPVLIDSESGIITCMMQYLVCYLPTNINNVTGEFSITEYGIGSAIDELWTHSWVYDIKGNKTYITKNINEKLEFTVYLCYSYYEYLITSGYEQNRFTLITTMQYFMNRMREEGVYTFKRNNVGYKREYNTRTSSKFENNSITYITPLKSFTLYQGTDAASGYIDGFCQWYTGFMSLETQQLDENEAESVDITNFYSLTPTSPSGFSEKFGHANYVPITQIDVTSVNMFNHKGNGDERWTNDVDYVNNKEKWYNETPIQNYFSTPIYYSNNNTVVGMYLYQNIRPEDKIIGIKCDAVTVYATDKYWDSSTWKLIKDFSNIPEDCQSARYWITSSNKNMITPIRECDDFHLAVKNEEDYVDGYETYLEFANNYGARAQCDNYEYGWYMFDNIVFYPGKTRRSSFTIGKSGSLSTESMTYDKWLVTFNTGLEGFYLTDMSNLVNSDPVPVQKQFEFNTSTDPISDAYRSESGTGIICVQSIKSSEARIIDLKSKSSDVKIANIQSKLASCIWGTQKVAYITDDEKPKLKVRDCDTEADIVDVDLPEDISNITFMFGHTRYVWITDGSTYAYALDLNNQNNWVACTNTIPINKNLNNYKMTAVDDVLILYNRADVDISKAFYIRMDYPNTCNNMSDFQISRSYLGQRIDFNLRYINSKTVNGKETKALVLLIDRGYHSSNADIGGAENMVIDFGQFLYDGTISRWSDYSNTWSSFILFGEFLLDRIKNRIPIMNYMPIRIKGTTRTITTLNWIKNISDKLWEVTFTNIPLFGTGEHNGLPPGKQN